MDINEHYTGSLSLELILERIRKHYPAGVTSYQLAPIDQLHLGGINASLELIKHLRPDESVLEIGAGLGGFIRLAREKSGVEITGLDISHGLNIVSKALFKLQNIENSPAIVTGDAQNLPFASNSFDTLIFQHSLLNIPDTEETLRECNRVLRSCGRIILHEIIQGDNYQHMAYPVPWALSQENSFLMDKGLLLDWLETTGFEVHQLTDCSAEALRWRERQAGKEKRIRMRKKDAQNKPVLSPELILGPQFSLMAANMAENLDQQAIRVIELIAIKKTNP